MLAPHLRLNDGRFIPQLGLGTWPMDDVHAESVVADAIRLGYRHVDTAIRYGNETGVGRGIARAVAESGVAREEIFVTTKVNGQHQGEKAADGLAESLERLDLDYVDLLLIHWPVPRLDMYAHTWRTLIELRERGLARSIGVSNFKPAHLERIITETGVVPAVNQIQVHPYIPRVEQRRVNAELGILTESWSPLAPDTELLSDPVITSIARAHSRTPGQVVLRWHVQHGLIAIPKTVSPARLAENLAVFDFDLTDADLEAIATLTLGPDAGVDSDVDGH